MAYSEVQLSGEELNDLSYRELHADPRADLSVYASPCATSLSSGSLMESSLSFVNSETGDNLYVDLSGDSISLEQPEQNSSVCTNSWPRSWLNAGAGRFVCNSNSVSCITGGTGTTSQTSPFSSRQLSLSPSILMTAITQHSTPISSPVKPLFHPEISAERNSDIYLTLDSTGSSANSLTFNSRFNSFDESNNSETSYLFLQEPTQSSVNASKKKIVEVVQPECCYQFCLLHLTASEISSTLEYFKSKNVTDQNRFLLDSFRVSSNNETTHHIICGKHVCKDAYIRILQISQKRYNHALKLHKANPTVKIERKCAVRSESTKVAEAKAWLERYFNRIGDSMPHIDQIHLPHGLTKRDIYYNMKSQLQEQGLNNIISLSHFYAIWNTSFEKVAIPKV